jgi:ribosomal protein S25
MARGRKPNQMTHRRRQVLDEIAEAVAHGERVTSSSLARRCGLYSYREATRIVRDLKKMGALI